jgi:hypothetical protein
VAFIMKSAGEFLCMFAADIYVSNLYKDNVEFPMLCVGHFLVKDKYLH